MNIELNKIIETDDNHEPFKTSVPKTQRTYWYQMIVHVVDHKLIVGLAHFYKTKCMDWAAYQYCPKINIDMANNVKHTCERGDKIDKDDALHFFPEFAKYRWRS